MLFGRLPRKSCHVPMTGLRLRRIPNRHCWPRSIGFTALPAASNRLQATKATLALSPTEAELPDLLPDEDRTMTNRTPVDRLRSLRLLSAFVGLSATLGACTNTTGEVVTASVP